MLDIIKILGTVIIVLVLLELLNLPDWIGQKLKGDISKKEIMDKIETLENRIQKLEKE
ncbi:MAG: hypothetical protein ACOCQ2_01580 [Halanaerobiales bacterium]